ncbi:unnamed protein product [Schistosoma mattheei]|uniref:Uncharacterized protein n=1 Tax=Schistosoma mattheei TaxID=31246 RepID=A0A3P8FMI4_9TREM|nr:unnamed protein product [Schistosoma mattheei]
MYLRVDFHSGTRNQYHSLQTLSRYPLSTVCTYAYKRLITYSPKNQWEGSSKTLPSELNFNPLHKQVDIRTQ